MQNHGWILRPSNSVSLASLLRQYQVQLRRSGRPISIAAAVRFTRRRPGGVSRQPEPRMSFIVFPAAPAAPYWTFVAAMERCTLARSGAEAGSSRRRCAATESASLWASNWLRKKVRPLRRSASPCAASTAHILIWRPAASNALRRRVRHRFLPRAGNLQRPAGDPHPQ